MCLPAYFLLLANDSCFFWALTEGFYGIFIMRPMYLIKFGLQLSSHHQSKVLEDLNLPVPSL